MSKDDFFSEIDEEVVLHAALSLVEMCAENDAAAEDNRELARRDLLKED